MYKKKPIPIPLKRRVIERDKGICLICEKQAIVKLNYTIPRIYEIKDRKKISFEVGHLLPEFLGGKLELDNLALMCRGCNREYQTHDLREFKKLREQEKLIEELEKKELSCSFTKK